MSTRQGQRTTDRLEVRVDRNEAARVLSETTHALSDMLRQHARDDRPIPHLTWTVGQCVAHMLISNWMYADQMTGRGIFMRIEQTSEINDWSVAPLTGLVPAELTADMERSTSHFLHVVSGLSEDATFTWWSGSQARVDTAIGLLVGERLVHGWDIAQALCVEWPIDPGAAAIAMEASFAVMPLLVDPQAAAGFDAAFDFRLRGRGCYELRFTDGTLTTSRAVDVERADCRISAEPVAMLLVGYGRVSQWGPILRGRLIAWGRKPWLGIRLARVLRNP